MRWMRWTRRGEDAARDSGMSTVEVVLLMPVVIIALMMMVELGMLANAKGVIDSASADAARMGSLQRTSAQAKTQATTVATGDLSGSVTCTNNRGGAPSVTPSGSFVAGGVYIVTVQCKVDYFGLSMTLSSVSASPIDRYREVN